MVLSYTQRRRLSAAAYACRVKPDKSDKLSVCPVQFVHYEEYLGRWHDLAGISSRENALNSST
ncbi:MAG TPA: hypothetical protein VFI31_08005 [Pirellulales bacterium]|nr:hypothetical protein [Pirellulales bacterium]